MLYRLLDNLREILTPFVNEALEMNLKVIKGSQTITIQADNFAIGPLPDSDENKQALLVFLREFRDNNNHWLFTHAELAAILGSTNRQASSSHCEEFRAVDRDILEFLQRRRKVDHTVVEAVRTIVSSSPLICRDTLTSQVNKKLDRIDLTAANIDAALEQVSCRIVRRSLRAQIESGQIQWSEQSLLEEMMSALTQASAVKFKTNATLIEKLTASGIDAVDDEADVSPSVATPPASSVVKTLLTPGADPASIPTLWQLTVFCMVLFGHGVPLSVLGSWLGVHKTTVLRRIIGLALGLWEPLSGLIGQRTRAITVYVDEKWVKIRGKWHYWFVALDAATEIPIISFLSAKRSRWACRWVFVRLKMIGKSSAVVLTDGLQAYEGAIHSVFPKAKHVLCIFHYKQSITIWLKKYVIDPEKIKKVKPMMKNILNTVDPRTVQRRLAALKEKAAEYGITDWIPLATKRLPALIPAIRRNLIPNTTNAVERFFRAFNRFYKTKAGFHSTASAKREFIIFTILYLFTIRWAKGQAPIESIWSEANKTSLYKLINNPLQIFVENDEIQGYLDKYKPLAAG